VTNPEKRRLVDRIKTIEKRMLIIVNPMSKRGPQIASGVRSLVRRAGMDLEETSTDHPDDIGSTVEFWSRRFGGSRVIMVFGGDGAVNQVVNNVMLSRSNKNVVLVPIPAGTANDFCRALGFDSVESSLEAMVDFNLRSVDLIKIEVDGPGRQVKYCSNIIGLGVDGDIAMNSQKYSRFGVVGYWYAAVRQATIAIFKGVDTYRMKIKADTFEREGAFIGTMFSNIATYGKSLNIAPGAKINDGKLYVTVAHPMNAIHAFFAGLLVLKGQHDKSRTVDTFVCTDVEIELLDDMNAQEDGEVYAYPKGTKIHLTVEKGALNVLAAPAPTN
jgi:diacylglycerol kinase family enzyme